VEALRFGVRAFVAIFPIVNPFSSAILLLALTPGDSNARRREQAGRAVVFMTAILIVSYFAGSAILNFFSISRPALVLAAVAANVFALMSSLRLQDVRPAPAPRADLPGVEDPLQGAVNQAHPAP